eukprot:Phypoly_transcript_17428.p1 GENE.Phypoly_transcript_17428~~Phypoly_transcript_17428.p1  ORF type:complete len:211 (+),score=44.02 Phypoly_transcript_17428:57-689(+)
MLVSNFISKMQEHQPQPITERPDELEKRQLYGGAIEIELPRRFQDISTFREVPSHQEVFVDVTTDQSFVVELLDLADTVPDKESAAFHYNTLAEDNGVRPGESRVIQTSEAPADLLPHFDPAVYKSILYGQQKVAKFKETAENLVNIYMCLIRLQEQSTDLMITLNEPIAIDPNSSSAPVVEQPTNPALTQQVFTHALKTLFIKDLSLFG